MKKYIINILEISLIIFCKLLFYNSIFNFANEIIIENLFFITQLLYTKKTLLR